MEGKYVAPKIQRDDLDAVFKAIGDGFTALRARMERLVDERLRTAAAELDAQFDTRVAAAVNEALERLTSPDATS